MWSGFVRSDSNEFVSFDANNSFNPNANGQAICRRGGSVAE
jgi:hypothetical protein